MPRINLTLSSDEYAKLHTKAVRYLRTPQNQTHWYLRKCLGINPPRHLNLPDNTGSHTTLRHREITAVETRLYCNKCNAEMEEANCATFTYRCPTCGLLETTTQRYPSQRPLTAAEIEHLTEG